jgi:pilus assembly protein Flp/PilA
MKKMRNFFNKLWKDEAGQGMVEYGLILALVAVAVVVVLGAIGTQMDVKFTEVLTKLGGSK